MTENNKSTVSYSVTIGRDNDYVHRQLWSFIEDVIYQLEVIGEMTHSDASGMITDDLWELMRDNYMASKAPTPVVAMNTAKDILNIGSDSPKTKYQIVDSKSEEPLEDCVWDNKDEALKHLCKLNEACEENGWEKRPYKVITTTTKS